MTPEETRNRLRHYIGEHKNGYFLMVKNGRLFLLNDDAIPGKAKQQMPESKINAHNLKQLERVGALGFTLPATWPC